VAPPGHRRARAATLVATLFVLVILALAAGLLPIASRAIPFSTMTANAAALMGQPPAEGAPASPAPDTADQPEKPAQTWDFGDDEDEDVPSFAQDLRAQVRDIGLMTAYLMLAFVSFFRKSTALKYVTFAASIGYIGFYKSQLMSIVNVFGLFGGNLPVFRYNLAWYLLAAVTLVSTVLWGRVYCGRICAFGALTQTLDVIIPPRFRVDVPRAIEKRASYIKYGILAFALAFFLVTKNPLIYPYIEPFWMFGIYGRSAGMWVGLAILLTATLFIRNLYCRFLCPSGRVPGPDFVCHGLPHQALVRVQHLQDLPEGLRVGSHRRTGHPQDRVRAVRRLRAALRGREEVPASPHHHPQGRHPGAAGGAAISSRLSSSHHTLVCEKACRDPRRTHPERFLNVLGAREHRSSSVGQPTGHLSFYTPLTSGRVRFGTLRLRGGDRCRSDVCSSSLPA
jgi:hypothetical protein